MSSFQLTPDVKYQVTVETSIGNPFDSTIVTTGSRAVANTVAFTEYWSLTADLMNALRGAAGSRLVLAGVPLDDPPTNFPVSGAYSTFCVPIGVIWSPMTSPPTGELWVSEGVNGYYPVGIDFANLVPPTSTTGAWDGWLTWYVCTDSPRQPSEPVVSPQATSLAWTTASASYGANHYWYSAKVYPAVPPPPRG